MITTRDLEYVQFLRPLQAITSWLDGRVVNEDLEARLNAAFPSECATFRDLETACRQGVASGWLANRGEAPLRWGRVIKASVETHGFSVDVVKMDDVAGPHHSHPEGEIDMIMPLDDTATFDGKGRGWKVFEKDSSHSPTVSGGSALVLYLLPGGKIQFEAQD